MRSRQTKRSLSAMTEAHLSRGAALYSDQIASARLPASACRLTRAGRPDQPPTCPRLTKQSFIRPISKHPVSPRLSSSATSAQPFVDFSFFGQAMRAPSAGQHTMVSRNAGFLTGTHTVEVLPTCPNEQDLDFYAGKFQRSGFLGPLNWYRNDRNWKQGAPWAGAKISMPALYMFGEHEMAKTFRGMDRLIPTLEGRCSLCRSMFHRRHRTQLLTQPTREHPRHIRRLMTRP